MDVRTMYINVGGLARLSNSIQLYDGYTLLYCTVLCSSKKTIHKPYKILPATIILYVFVAFVELYIDVTATLNKTIQNDR